MRRRDVHSVEVRPEREEAWHRKIRRMSAKTVYEVGGCQSYYLDDDGRNVVMWPGFTAEYQLRTRRFNPSAYIVRRHSSAREADPAAVRDRVHA